MHQRWSRHWALDALAPPTRATVHNATHLSCSTVRLHNSAPATLRASLDNGTTWLPGQPRIEITPLVEVAVGRRPYTSELEGQLVVKVAGAPLLPAGAEVQIVAKLPASVHAPLLLSGSAVAGRTALLRFPLGGVWAANLACST